MDTVLNSGSRKRMVKKAAVIFFIIVVLLTFFSKTINSMLMPEVECTVYYKSSLNKDIYTAGEIRPADIERVIAWRDMKVTEVRVKEGATVTKGTVLALTDTGDMNLKLKTMELEVKRAENAYESYKSQYKAAAEPSENPNKKWLLKDLEEAQKKFDEAMALYENGLEEYKGVEACQKEIDIIKEKIDDMDKGEEEAKKGMQDFERGLLEKEKELQIKKLELENYKKSCEDNGEIKSMVDGVVYSVSIEKGITYNNGQQLFEIMPETSGYKLEWKLNTAKAELLNTGDNVDIEIAGEDKLSFETGIGQRKYVAAEGLFLYTAALNSKDNNFKPGQAEIKIIKRSVDYPMVVPNSCIFQSGGQKKVFILKHRDGVMGEELYVKSLDVKVLDSNDLDSAILGSITEVDEIVSFSSKVLEDGVRVKLR